MSLTTTVRRNVPEYLIIAVILLINIIFVYPYMAEAMIHDLKINELFVSLYYTKMRYFGLTIAITLVTVTCGFSFIQELVGLSRKMRLVRTISRKDFDASVIKVGGRGLIFLGAVAFVVLLEVSAIWFFHVKEVDLELLNLGIKSGIWLLGVLTISLLGCLVLEGVRRKRTGVRAVVSH